MSKKAAITEIVKMRDQLVIMRERLFQLSAATAARTKESRNPREANETPT
jgi:hypothetical protein